ncbi:mitochondrial glyco protein, partial [Dimargaris cristalligena]
LSNRAFSLTTRWSSQGMADKDLAHALQRELTYEEEKETDNLPTFLESFIAKDQFKIEDTPGANEVVLTRTFGTESITITFSAAEIHNAEDMIDGERESFENQEELPSESEEAAAEDDMHDVSIPGNNYPVRFNVVIEKPGRPTLSFDLTAEDGDYGVDHICTYKSGKLAKDQTSEADYQRRGLYMGPAFGFLDDDLKSAFEKYLEERGIDEEMAMFIPDYIDYKEQNEYTRWLKEVKEFVEA